MKSAIFPIFLAVSSLLHRAAAAVVLSNVPDGTTSPTLVSGTGGFLPPLSTGFSFTVTGAQPWRFESVSLAIGGAGPASALAVDLMHSPGTPDTATLIGTLAGPGVPTGSAADWLATGAPTLLPGETYFVRISVPSGSGQFSVGRTTDGPVGTWTYGGTWARAGSASWSLRPPTTAILFGVNASMVPEPRGAAGVVGAGAALLAARRRRTSARRQAPSEA